MNREVGKPLESTPNSSMKQLILFGCSMREIARLVRFGTASVSMVSMAGQRFQW
jgi:hypothetical protein